MAHYSGGFGSARRAMRRNIVPVTVTHSLKPTGTLPATQMLYVHAAPSALQIRNIYIWLEAQDATETITTYRAASGTAIEGGDALHDAFSLASATNALDTAHEVTLSTSVHHYVEQGDALGIVLSAGTDTVNGVITIHMVPA